MRKKIPFANCATALAMTLQLVFVNTSAQTLEAIDPNLPKIEVTGFRDPELMEYKDVVTIRNAFSHLDKTPIRVALRVTNRRTGKAPRNLRINFLADGKQTEIPVRSGLILLDELPVSENPDAEFVSNMRKGSLKMEILLALHTEDLGQVQMSDVRKALEIGNDALGKLPWYLRLILPKLESALACFAEENGSVTIGKTGAQKTLDASPAENCVEFKPAISTNDAPIEFSKSFLYLRLQ
ncbi:hypothetical protein [Pseudoduganella sp. RAF53_2]|uniref:hypothetical protein n=1 Tax=unclassified Pseudoduganella TaxID=2637179 RepID=UPI003F9B847F